MADTNVRVVARASGVAAVAVAFAGILAAVATAPWFSWTGNALSDLGVAGGLTEALFNYSLVAGGLLGVPFAWWYASDAATRAGLAAGVAFGVASTCLAGVGVFPTGTPLHAPAALGFYVLGTYALGLDASDAVLAGDARRALAWFWVALAHFTFWLLWAVVAVFADVSGIAIPEAAGALAVAAWVVTTARRRPRRR